MPASVQGSADKLPSDYLAAAVRVLRDQGRPMTTSEITRLALERGLIAPRGKTPEAKMRARLYGAVRDDPSCPIQRTFKPGAVRAVRDSVRWNLRDGSATDQ